MLVDDNADIRMIFREVFGQSGHDVKEARDRIEGLALILAEKPAVAIVDIDLPGMDGYEVARRVRSALGHSVLLVAMTAYCTHHDRSFQPHRDRSIRRIMTASDPARSEATARSAVRWFPGFASSRPF